MNGALGTSSYDVAAQQTIPPLLLKFQCATVIMKERNISTRMSSITLRMAWVGAWLQSVKLMAESVEKSMNVLQLLYHHLHLVLLHLQHQVKQVFL